MMTTDLLFPIVAGLLAIVTALLLLVRWRARYSGRPFQAILWILLGVCGIIVIIGSIVTDWTMAPLLALLALLFALTALTHQRYTQK